MVVPRFTAAVLAFDRSKAAAALVSLDALLA
jgi:hypothetical protein